MGSGLVSERSAAGGGQRTRKVRIRSIDGTHGLRWVYDPQALVNDRVMLERTTLRYFARSCFYEGLGKAELAAVCGSSRVRRIEAEFAPTALRTGLANEVAATLRGDAAGLRGRSQSSQGSHARSLDMARVVSVSGNVVRSRLLARGSVPCAGGDVVTPTDRISARGGRACR